jgi:hypothetical protein
MDRRTFLGAAAVAALAPLARAADDSDAELTAPLVAEWVDGIPVIWAEPAQRRDGNQLVLWINGFGNVKEQLDRNLLDLSKRGFIAVSFDAWQHGLRGTETKAALVARVFGQFRRYMWPIIGQTALDASRVIDWAMQKFQLRGGVSIGGVSMGGADAHVPAEATLRFQAALTATYGGDSSRLRVHVEDGVGHEVTWAAWKRSLGWLSDH